MSTVLSKKQMTEEDIKLNYITPAILKGWKGHITMETKITDGRINIRGNIVARSKPKFADYLLYLNDGKPIAVVEAKDNNHSVSHGLQQAMSYLQNLAEELRETERQLSKLDEGRKNNMIAIRDMEMTKERLLSFAEYAKDAQPEVLVTLIQTIVERIYIVDKDDERYCHIFIKGCSGEDYTGFFRTAGYIEDNSTSMCDSEQCCICTEISENGDVANPKVYNGVMRKLERLQNE